MSEERRADGPHVRNEVSVTRSDGVGGIVQEPVSGAPVSLRRELVIDRELSADELELMKNGNFPDDILNQLQSQPLEGIDGFPVIT